jgi:hypothetical protein
VPTLDPPVLDWGTGSRSAMREARERHPAALALTVFVAALVGTLVVVVVAVAVMRG